MTNSRFYPELAYISDITNDLNAVVTFTAAHDFTPGEYISFRVSPSYGMYEINNLKGKVLSITPLTVTVDIDTLGFNTFILPLSPGAVPAIAVPAGSGIEPASNPATMNLHDAFDDIRI